MTTHVRVLIGEREAALAAPRAAIRRRQGGEYVVVERAGRWVEQTVTTGWRTSNSVEILSGLQEGETLELNPI
jgi:multidrug efflux pump subunit AcrA (membrane-fusion protein)